MVICDLSYNIFVYKLSSLDFLSFHKSFAYLAFYIPILTKFYIYAHCHKTYPPNLKAQTLTFLYTGFALLVPSVGLGWFSVGICKYKLGYKSHDLLYICVLSLVEITAFRLESKSCKGFFFQ